MESIKRKNTETNNTSVIWAEVTIISENSFSDNWFLKLITERLQTTTKNV